jgi:PKD repeat protein
VECMNMKRIWLSILVFLIGGIVAFGGIEPKAETIAASLGEQAPIDAREITAEEDSGEASGELSAVFLGEEPSGDSASAESLTATLRLSHSTVETMIVTTLDASGSTGSSSEIVLYEWDLDGDGAYDASTEGPKFARVFDDDGTYAIRVRVTNEQGETAESEPAELVVLNRVPVARFVVASASSTEAAEYAFRDASTDLDGTISRWSWTFGDGAVSGEPNPIHGYGDEGSYTVTLVVIDEDGGESAPVSREFVVENVAPVAEFALESRSSVVGQPVRFVDESADPSPNGSIVHVAWDFGDGTYLAGGPVASGEYAHTYATAGAYTVTLYVVDDDGSMSYVSTELFVVN